MARIYKIAAYIVDPNEEYENGEQWFAEAIQNSGVYCPVPIDHQTAEFEWKDNLPINYIGCTKWDCEMYFDEQGEQNV